MTISLVSKVDQMVMHDEDESSDDNGDDGDDGDNDDDGGGDNGDNCADNFHLDLDCPQQKDSFLLSHLLQYHRSQYNRTAVLAGFTIETLDETSTNSKNGIDHIIISSLFQPGHILVIFCVIVIVIFMIVVSTCFFPCLGVLVPRPDSTRRTRWEKNA